MQREIESVSRIAAIGFAFVGYSIDVINKLFRESYPFGQNTLPENHSGNFLTSATLAVIARRVAAPLLNEKLHLQVTDQDMDTAAFLITFGLNIAAETYWSLMGPNPEFWGDIICGTLAAGLVLYGSSRQSAVGQNPLS